MNIINISKTKGRNAMLRKQVELKKSTIEELKEEYAETKNNKYKRKLYHLLLSQLDDISVEYIKKLDDIIDRISNVFMEYGGWCVGRKSIDNFSSRQLTPEYRTFRLIRDINGYHSQETPKELYMHSTEIAEESFLTNRKIELGILHNAYLMKDEILYGRNYTLKDPSKEQLVEELREFFGYNNPEDTILPPKVETVEETPAGPKL